MRQHGFLLLLSAALGSTPTAAESPASPAAVTAAAAAAAAAAGVVPCEYWLCEESATGGYSKLNVSALGLQTNRTIAVNANTFGAGKTMPFPNGSLSHVPLTLRDYLAFTRSELRSIMTLRLLPKVLGGAATTNVVILDLEYPFQYVHPCQWGQLNASTLAAVVNATRLRIQVARELMPKAGLALYATVRGFDGCTGPGPMAGFHRAAALGVFDDLTHLVPVLYMGSKTNAPQAVASTLEATLTLRPRDNRTLPMVILLSWVLVNGAGTTFCRGIFLCMSRACLGKSIVFPARKSQRKTPSHLHAGRREGCALEYSHLHNLLSAVGSFEAAHPGHVGAVRRTPFSRHLVLKPIILPRQARDKHRENSQNECGAFSCRWHSGQERMTRGRRPPKCAARWTSRGATMSGYAVRRSFPVLACRRIEHR